MRKTLSYIGIFTMLIIILSGCTTDYIVSFETNGGTEIENIIISASQGMIERMQV